VLRPAVVLADARRDDFVPCQLTSNRYADSRANFANEGVYEWPFERSGNVDVKRAFTRRTTSSTVKPNSRVRSL